MNEKNRNAPQNGEVRSKINKRTRRRLPVWAVILIVLGGVLLILGSAAAVLAFGLLNRIQRPETPTVFLEETAEVEITPLPQETAEPSPTPEKTPTPTPTPLPTPTPEIVLPLSDVYPQTPLSEAQREQLNKDMQLDKLYVNVLLLGVDRRGGSGVSNTDTMMIATLDKRNKRIKLTSILRDMLVDVPGKGYAKLNSAAPAGGIQLLQQTLNSSFGMNLKYYVLVDFSMFEKIIDKMDGITIRMSAEEISAANDCIAGLNKQRGIYDFYDGFIFAEAGNVRLTGKQALGYARIRHTDSDFTRTQRQYKVLNTVFASFRRMSISRQYDLMYDLLPLVETNMGSVQLLSLASSALGMDTSGIASFRIPADNTYEGARYERKQVLLTDLTQNTLLLHDFIYRSSEEGESMPELEPGASTAPYTPDPNNPLVQEYWNSLLGITPSPTPFNPTLPGEEWDFGD